MTSPKSNVFGVSWYKTRQKWRVQKYDKHIAHFNTQEEAEFYAHKIQCVEDVPVIIQEIKDKRYSETIQMLKSYGVDPNNLDSIENWRRCIKWNPDTGLMIWKACPNPFSCYIESWESRWLNQPAFNSLSGNGYSTGMFLSKVYRAHRVIWFLEHSQWPSEQLDHVNHIRTDNRLVNLREVTHQQNHMNQSMMSNNTSGESNIYLTPNGKYRVQITKNNNKYSKTFDTLEEAIIWRDQKLVELGFHLNHGSRHL